MNARKIKEKQKETGATIIPPSKPNPKELFFLTKLKIIMRR